MTRLVLPANPIADDRADLLIAGREVLAEGFRRYERLRVRRSGENVPRPLDVLRSGPAAAVLPIDPGRDEVVLLRQFRLAAHLANGREIWSRSSPVTSKRTSSRPRLPAANVSRKSAWLPPSWSNCSPI